MKVSELFNHNWLVYKIHDAYLEQAARKYARGILLDVGCAEKRYKRMFAPYVTQHVGLDHDGTFHNQDEIDLFGTATVIPAPDESFDTILCTAVLEHLEEPAEAIHEMGRVLRKGGHGIFTVPLFWHLHEAPRDFYRYTKFWLEYLFGKNGFEIMELRALSGFCVTFGQELVYFLQRFRRGYVLNGLVVTLGASIQGLAYFLNRLDHSYDFTWMYLVIVRKRDVNDLRPSVN